MGSLLSEFKIEEEASFLAFDELVNEGFLTSSSSEIISPSSTLSKVVIISDETGADADEDAHAFSEFEMHATILSLLSAVLSVSFSHLFSPSMKSFLSVCLGVLCCST